MNDFCEEKPIEVSIYTEKSMGRNTVQINGKCFVEPLYPGKFKQRVTNVEEAFKESVKVSVNRYGISDDRLIVGFDCTKKNMMMEKKSRLKFEIYLCCDESFNEDECYDYAKKFSEPICEAICQSGSENGLSITSC